MRRISLAIALCLGLCPAAGWAGEKDRPAKGGGKATPAAFKGLAELVDAVDIATGFSPDKQVATVLFRNLMASTGDLKGQRVGTRTVTLSVPFEAKDKTPLTQDIRGYVSLGGSARAALVVQAAGKTTVVDLMKAKQQATERPEEPSDAAKQAREQAQAQAKGLPPQAKAERSFDFFHRIRGTAAAGAGYQVTFFLLVERDDDAAESAGLVVIDSLDINLAPKGVGKKKN